MPEYEVQINRAIRRPWWKDTVTVNGIKGIPITGKSGNHRAVFSIGKNMILKYDYGTRRGYPYQTWYELNLLKRVLPEDRDHFPKLYASGVWGPRRHAWSLTEQLDTSKRYRAWEDPTGLEKFSHQYQIVEWGQIGFRGVTPVIYDFGV